jgi:hypothetical protein
MNTGKYVFAQLTLYLDKNKFDSLTQKYSGNKYVRHFTCWNQLLSMIFGQLTHRESLSDLILVINAHRNKIYHLGLGRSVTKGNLAKANKNRNCKIFEEFAYYLVDVARKKCNSDDFQIKGKIYAFDSSTIDLCLNIFWWAKFRKKKGGVKLHTLFDITTQIPVFIHITSAKVNDVNAMDEITYEVGAYYIFDRGYNDFSRLYSITTLFAFFVVRAKKNLKFRRVYSNKVDKSTGVKCDQIGLFTGYYQAKDYPDKVRRIKYYDEETDKEFVFLTNNFELSALEVALLYKQRWQVELFFKWIKQHLKVKSFWGYSENAVRIQIYTAIITYCLVAIVGKELKTEYSTYEILQILGMSLLDKTPLNELFTKIDYKDVKELNDKQLKISFI